MTLDEILAIPYEPNGRSQSGADCYGIVRMARVYLFNKPWMPVHGGVEGSDKRALTEAVRAEAPNYREVRPQPGAIACAFRGTLCTHIAIVIDVDGKRMILETDEPGRGGHGPRLVNLRYFEQRFLKVVYYDD
tara:strand:+ start:10009 stop:10407 length:399 start_codon:yes stop_codon:yes gene_type:complete